MVRVTSDVPILPHLGPAMYRITAYDADLKPYAILVEYTDEGSPRLMTADGKEVRRIERGEYDIVDSKATIRVLSDDPAGP